MNITDLERLCLALNTIGIHYQAEICEGWGLPDRYHNFSEGEFDEWRLVKDISLGCYHLYFDIDTEQFLGGYDSEFSTFKERKTDGV